MEHELYDPALLSYCPEPESTGLSAHAIYLRDLRISANCTQKELGIKLNVATETVSRWETGHTTLSGLVLLAAEHVLSCCGRGLHAGAIATSS
jgi:DNA-binding transcriptional regulator YiaG